VVLPPKIQTHCMHVRVKGTDAHVASLASPSGLRRLMTAVQSSRKAPLADPLHFVAVNVRIPLVCMTIVP
jgi:hypothetical protein